MKVFGFLFAGSKRRYNAPVFGGVFAFGNATHAINSAKRDRGTILARLARFDMGLCAAARIHFAHISIPIESEWCGAAHGCRSERF